MRGSGGQDKRVGRADEGEGKGEARDIRSFPGET